MTITPFLKWAGGKRWFFAAHRHLLPKSFNTYFEPFLGSGAIYFRLQPQKAVLGDLNAEVIDAYSGLKKDWEAVQKRLEVHAKRHSRSHYYSVRDASYSGPADRAARFLYLNRTCFNGIYRVNRQGQFNVPLGTKTSVVLPSDDFAAISKLLKGAKLVHSDFAALIDEARKGDFVFADPPYTVRHNSNAFVKYNESLFSWDDQIRLADCLTRAKRRGVRIVLTNANHASVRGLYRERGFAMTAVSRFSPIAASAADRGRYSELVITANVGERNS